MRGGGGAGGGPSIHDDHGDISTMNTTIKTRDSVTFKREEGTASDHTNSTDQQLEEKSTKTPYTARSLDLRTNENQFHVIASLIVDKYENILSSGAESFRLTPIDKMQLDRLVPARIRQNFVEAVKLRLKTCPDEITRPIHVVLRKCEALGLDRNGNQNLLFAPEGTIIFIHHQRKQIMDDISVAAQSAHSTEETPEERLARRQLLAEHREASNLMAESVTPEAAQFWRKHVVDLQARLRSLHAKSGSVRVSDGTEQIMRNNEGLLASLNDNTGYVPPKEDFFEEIRSRQATEPPVQPSAPQHEIVERIVEDGALPMVDVVAPSDLPGGYTFEAEISGKRFLATVPAGGVRKGETFSSVMKNVIEPGKTAGVATKKGQDSIFHCFKYGCFHPLVTNAIFCPLIALAQIMTRLRLDFLGRAGYNVPKEGLWSTFGMVKFILSFWLFLNCTIVLGIGIKLLTQAGISGADLTSLALVNLSMFLYTVYAVASTRRSIREKYDIDESHRCADQEDILCAMCCMSCTICQMGRQSADYENHRAAYFTDTGLQKVTGGGGASEFEMV